MIKTDQINHLLGIKESYQASDALTKILFDKDKREELFKSFLAEDCNLEKDWFHVYFEEEHANKLKYAQDFTPDSIALLLSRLIGDKSGMRMDVASGTGSLVIKKWHEDCLAHSPFDFRPSMYFYHCEELSDRAMPFLLFNLMIRGMNAVVIHGDTLTREAKQVFFIQNDSDDFMKFSNINVMPHSKQVEEVFDIRRWLEPEMIHVESSIKVLNRMGVNGIEPFR
ncbi:N-6 DNA methylase [Enterococcus dispar]|uniref:N-6 DNA methylase n=1 Tax=Enterococcus dispar TaxID=44009 RepID=UPI0023312427|nr:N-6 DNA methylase [Enterococcus dispar]WCG32969.1 N-6 DNA methylase [Enterococcus dispar]